MFKDSKNQRHCANCLCYLGRSTGTSGIYRPNASEEILLCEPCFFEEEELTLNSNHFPERLRKYYANLDSVGEYVEHIFPPE